MVGRMVSWRVLRRALFTLILGAVTTAVVATSLANAATWREAAAARAYNGTRDEGEAHRQLGRTNLACLRQVEQRGVSVSLVYELRDGCTVSSDGTTVIYPTGWRELTLPVSKTILPSRLAPSNCPSANSLRAYTFGWPYAAMGYRNYSSHEGCFMTDYGCRNWIAIKSRSAKASNWRPLSSPSHPSPEDSWGIPTDVDPRGFALNTAAFGGTWFASFTLFAFVRDRRVKQRNICKHCSYSRDGIAAEKVCPECGRAPHA
jgi:hypothetical protein